MIRLFLHLFKIKDYESCKSCETLKSQLDFANTEKKELLETLLLLTKPVVVTQTPEVKILNPLQQAGSTFARRRGILEDMHKKKEDTIKNSPFIAKPDDVAPKVHITQENISEMEKKLGLADEA